MKAIIQHGKRLGTALVAVVLLAGTVAPAHAQSTNAQIEALLAQIAALQAQSASASVVFTRDLSIGSRGADVTALQQYLISRGFSIPAGPTGYFGVQTRAALAAYQSANGIAPPAGYFGPITRTHINAQGPSPSPSTPDDDDFFGGTDEGFLDDFDEIGRFNNEEVGEDDEVEVLGVEFTAEDADQMITRVSVEIDTPTGNDDLEDFIDEVSILLDGEVLDTMSVDDASHDRSNDEYTFRFTNLDGIVEEGETADLTVSVTAVNNVDTNDEGDGWTVTIPADGIRAVSPNGVDDTYDSSAFSTTFTIESFASANEVELDLSLSEDNPDEGIALIEDEGDEIVLLEFEMEADGSDLLILELPFAITTATANVEDTIDELTLEIDGDEHSENVSDNNSTSQTVTFDDLELELDEGESVTVRLIGSSATSTPGNDLTIVAELTESSVEAEDESGEDLAAADISGTANGETQHLFEIAPEIEVISTDIDPIENGDQPAESATARIIVELTARGGTIYLNGDNESTAADEFFVIDVLGGDGNSSIASWTHSVSGDYEIVNSGADNEYYEVDEDDTIRVEITAIVNQAAVTASPILVGAQGTMIQFGTDDTDQTTRSAIELDWTDLTDELQTPRAALVNPS